MHLDSLQLPVYEIGRSDDLNEISFLIASSEAPADDGLGRTTLLEIGPRYVEIEACCDWTDHLSCYYGTIHCLIEGYLRVLWPAPSS